MTLVRTKIECSPELTEPEVYKKIELCGRVAYKSEYRITNDSARDFVKALIRRGHESVLEHVNVTMRLITDRATANAWVRHRIAAYTQESTIYCDYHKSGDIALRAPFFFGKDAVTAHVWEKAMKEAEHYYNMLRELGYSPGMARDVLPSATKTELIATHNIREWRHIIRARSVAGDSKGMSLLTHKVLSFFKVYIPLLFEDIDFSPALLEAAELEREYYGS